MENQQNRYPVFILLLILMFFSSILLAYTYLNHFSLFNSSKKNIEQASKISERTAETDFSIIKSRDTSDLPPPINKKSATISDLPEIVSILLVNAKDINVQSAVYSATSTGYFVTYTEEKDNIQTFRPAIELIRKSGGKIIQGLFIDKSAIIDFEYENYLVEMEFIESKPKYTNVNVRILQKL